MALNWFKKKTGVVDLRRKSDSITVVNSASSESLNTNSNAPIAPAQESSGGMFNFWGNSDSSSSNQTSSSSSSSTDSDKIIRVERRADDIADRLSRALDRIDLLEKKMDRLERKGL
jgi:hypothetical protein